MTDKYIHGDHLLIDDITGLRVRASEAQKMWDGKLVKARGVWEPRHPQDLVRGRKEQAAVKDGRPRQALSFIGPLTTVLAAAVSPGATSLTVESAARMAPDDRIAVMLSNGDTCRRIILAVPDAATITLTEGLPDAAAAGNAVINNSAMAAPEL